MSSRPPLVRNLVGQNGAGGELSSPIDLASSLNYVMNSNFDFSQRGQSFNNPGSDTYTVDRWQVGYDGSGQSFNVSKAPVTPGILPTSATSCLAYNQTVAPTGQTSNVCVYHIEDVNTLQGKTVTIGFYATADAAYEIGLQFVQHFGSGGSDDVILSPLSFTTTTGGPFGGFAYYEFTLDIPSVLGKTIGSTHFLYFYFSLPINVTFAFAVTSIMLNEGSIAAPHVLMGRDYGGELRFCQRYFEMSYNQGTDPGTSASQTENQPVGQSTVPNGAYYSKTEFKVSKRTPPLVTVYGYFGEQGVASNGSGGASFGAGSANVGVNTENNFSLLNSSGAGLATGLQMIIFNWTADAEF